MTGWGRMHQHNWKYYTKLIIESIVTFYLATFCLAYFFTHHGADQPALAVLQATLFLFIAGTTTYRIVKGLPIAGLMLAVPIAPLLILIIVVTMIPILEKF